MDARHRSRSRRRVVVNSSDEDEGPTGLTVSDRATPLALATLDDDDEPKAPVVECPSCYELHRAMQLVACCHVFCAECVQHMRDEAKRKGLERATCVLCHESFGDDDICAAPMSSPPTAHRDTALIASATTKRARRNHHGNAVLEDALKMLSQNQERVVELRAELKDALRQHDAEIAFVQSSLQSVLHEIAQGFATDSELALRTAAETTLQETAHRLAAGVVKELTTARANLQSVLDSAVVALQQAEQTVQAIGPIQARFSAVDKLVAHFAVVNLVNQRLICLQETPVLAMTLDRLSCMQTRLFVLLPLAEEAHMPGSWQPDWSPLRVCLARRFYAQLCVQRIVFENTSDDRTSWIGCTALSDTDQEYQIMIATHDYGRMWSQDGVFKQDIYFEHKFTSVDVVGDTVWVMSFWNVLKAYSIEMDTVVCGHKLPPGSRMFAGARDPSGRRHNEFLLLLSNGVRRYTAKGAIVWATSLKDALEPIDSTAAPSLVCSEYGEVFALINNDTLIFLSPEGVFLRKVVVELGMNLLYADHHLIVNNGKTLFQYSRDGKLVRQVAKPDWFSASKMCVLPYGRFICSATKRTRVYSF